LRGELQDGDVYADNAFHVVNRCNNIIAWNKKAMKNPGTSLKQARTYSPMGYGSGPPIKNMDIG
jgi:hypothetical protein